MLLSHYPEVEIVGEADGVGSAIKVVQRSDPDVVFLDVQMPRQSGFDLLNKYNVRSKVVFVTAYDEYAIRAFEVHAFDYLLKPIKQDRLAQTIQRIREENHSPDVKKKPFVYNDYLFLPSEGCLEVVKVNLIECISVSGDYSEVFTSNGKKLIVLRSLKQWEQKLPENSFVRIHRSTIINLEYIERIETWFNYSYKVYLRGIREPLVMSRRYASKLKEKLA